MLGKAQAKVIKMLQQKKQRKKEGLFIVEGDKMVREAIESSLVIREIYATASWLLNTGYANSDFSHLFTIVEEKDIKKISSLSSPQDVLAIIEIPKHANKIDPDQQLVLALDRVKDPGNLGTILRIADWFGVEDIVCSTDCVDAYNPKTVQASMGSIFRVRVHYLDLGEWLSVLSAEIYGADLGGENLWEESLEPKGVLVMGSESHGISAELKKYIHTPLAIPSFGGAESLNVAVATAIFCAEFAKAKLKV